MWRALAPRVAAPPDLLQVGGEGWGHCVGSLGGPGGLGARPEVGARILRQAVAGGRSCRSFGGNQEFCARPPTWRGSWACLRSRRGTGQGLGQGPLDSQWGRDWLGGGVGGDTAGQLGGHRQLCRPSLASSRGLDVSVHLGTESSRPKDTSSHRIPWPGALLMSRCLPGCPRTAAAVSPTLSQKQRLSCGR